MIRRIIPRAAALAAALPMMVQAGVNVVFHPYVEVGEWELEARGIVTEDDDPALDGAQVIKTDIAYGVTPRWWTELEFEFEKIRGESFELEAIASENVFQITERGQYFADFGLFAEYEKLREQDVHEVTLGPIVQKDIGPFSATANLFFEHAFGDDAEEREIETLVASQFVYRSAPALMPGVEYYGDAETQNLGPGVFGSCRLGANKLKYELALMFGLDHDTPEQTWRWLAEYEF